MVLIAFDHLAPMTNITMSSDEHCKHSGSSYGGEEDPFRYKTGNLKTLLDSAWGSFETVGSFSTPAVLSGKIVIDGLGIAGLPLHPSMPLAIKEKAERASYGRGRQTWKLSPAQISVTGTLWGTTMNKLVSRACYKLGISNEDVTKLCIEAHLYNALLCEEGGHFKTYEDAVKAPGIFGTLVIQLPRQFRGGASIVSHQGESVSFDMEAGCESHFLCTAVHADCEHRIWPIVEGFRFHLVFNFVRDKAR